jgi:very-short-patch-repair endonuclease
VLSVRELKRAVENCRSKLSALNIPEDVDPSVEALREWATNYSELATHEIGRLDFLPWSKPSRLRKELSRIEQQLRPGFQLELWTRIGVLNDEGRQKLAPIIEATRQWLELRKKREEANVLINFIIAKFQELRSKASILRLSDIPTKAETEAWKLIISQCEGTAKIANIAAVAWRKRAEKEEVEETLRRVAKEWVQIASGVPIWEGWRRNQGKIFDEALILLADHPNSQNVVKARSAFYSGALGRLIESWQAIFNYEQKAFQLRFNLNEISKPSDRLIEWWGNRPQNACVLDRRPSDWPEIEKPLETMRTLRDWCLRWNEFTKVTRPGEEAKAQEELEWAVSKLKQAISVLPDTSERIRITDIYTTIKRKPGDNWPIPDLNEAFAGFGSDRIRAKIQHTRAKLEKESFDYAKVNWVERLLSDDDSIRAVDTLEQSLQQNRGQIVEAHYETFRAALRTVPIWITTAQAANAIPLEPEIFDIVVIDEASQCTLTNLLPLMYRGRTLVVIGDDNQLPAIPTIQETEELGLARKFDIENHLSLLGHYSNNVYKTAVESLPRRRADVIMLVEHFRSHPQIIGFSNRHIYSQRLELKKDPNWGKRLPVGSGVHAQQIVGSVRRGKNGRSWMNMPEAEAVVALVQQLRVGDSRSLRLGIVTPFVAQKEVIWDKLDSLELSSDILVDTAYGFQGDERDVIIFSPVVARGMTVSATLWVETPPNLINVAITRAREAFFFVGDLDFCLQLKGILRKLALYCREIQLLRKTSPAELELFSWMVVKGWDPKIHLRIGDIEVDFTLQARNGIRLAIEVDGRQYHEGSKAQDKARDAFLYAQGYDVLRATAREVLETPFEVIHQIEQRLLAQ